MIKLLHAKKRANHFGTNIAKQAAENESKAYAASSFTLEADPQDVNNAIGLAFAGNESLGVPGEPFMDWALSHHEFASQEERNQLVKFCMAFPLLEDERCANAFQLCVKAAPNQPEIAAVASVREFDPTTAKSSFKMWRQKWDIVRSLAYIMVTQHGKDIPPLLISRQQREDLKLFEAKTTLWQKDSDRFHSKYGPKGKHWYIHIVGCDPSFQGQGKGKALMNKLCSLADQAGKDVYLEAGERNRPFYERFGFRVRGAVVLVNPKDPSDQFEMHLMTRIADQVYV